MSIFATENNNIRQWLRKILNVICDLEHFDARSQVSRSWYFNSGSEHSEIFISVFYLNWLIIRKFYLNLHTINCTRQSEKNLSLRSFVLSLHKIKLHSAIWKNLSSRSIVLSLRHLKQCLAVLLHIL